MKEPVAYSQWNDFGVEEYVSRCYGPRIMNVDLELIKGAIEAMRRLSLEPGSWRHAADIGTGPNLFPALLLAPFLLPKHRGGRLDLIDISAPTRRYLRDVLDAPEALAPSLNVWEKYERLMADQSSIWQHSLKAVRALAKIKSGDIFALAPEIYDAVSTFFVPESITDSREECNLAVAKIIAATKPGGFIIAGHILNSRCWHAGNGTRYPAVPLTIDDVRKLYEDHLEAMTMIQPPLTAEVRPDFNGAVLVVGKKKNQSVVRWAFTPNDIQNCLYDERRVEYFHEAISATVKRGDIVVDGGSGTGVLGLLAAKTGAAKVYCIEINHEYAQVIRENAKNNSLADKIVVLPADATTIDLPEKVDVIISEAISGGLFYEPQLQIVSNLRRFLKPEGSIIPAAMTNYVELVCAQDELYGLKFDYDTRHRILNDIPLTTRSSYLNVEFHHNTPFSVVADATVIALKTGRANAIRIPYTLQLSECVHIETPTEFLLNPQIIFLPEPVMIRKGAHYNVSLLYEAGQSPLTCRITIRPVS